jgi:cyanophycinase
MMSPGHEVGLGLFRNAAIDQHLATRHREDDLTEVIAARPEFLGIGLDDTAAIVVRGDRFEVIGRGRVAVHDGRTHGEKPYFFLRAGDRFDLKTLTPIRPD